MKKIIFAALLSAMATAGAGAQNMYDALTFGQNNYTGTARSLGMGNAVTSVGGDIGSVIFNPAGSAVAGYSQFTLSPGLIISSVNASGSEEYGFENRNRTLKAGMTMPNFGFVLRNSTGRRSGIVNWSFGFIGNATNYYRNSLEASGTNSNTSYAGYMAAMADNYTLDEIFRYRELQDLAVAYDSFIISDYNDPRLGSGFIGTTEKLFENGDIRLAGPLRQEFIRSTSGNKYDYLFNFGANVQNVLYFGANIGVALLDYSSSEYIREKSIDRQLFDIPFDDGTVMYFNNLEHLYTYYASGSGIYAKIGAILTPGNGLRIGAAFETPTRLDIRERWFYEAGTDFFTESYYAPDIHDDNPDMLESSYRLRTPYKVNAGISYTFGRVGMISADYEFQDLGSMKFKMPAGYRMNNDAFYYDNHALNLFSGGQHTFRIGGEFKPVPMFTVRAGFNYISSPEYCLYDSIGAVYASDYYDMASFAESGELSYGEFDRWEASLYDKKRIGEGTHSITFGLGYSSGKSFFADVAFRARRLPAEYVMPYGNYIPDFSSPVIESLAKTFDVVFTAGWRF